MPQDTVASLFKK